LVCCSKLSPFVHITYAFFTRTICGYTLVVYSYDATHVKGQPKIGVIKMTESPKCGCGRSPTGNCIGWHALSEEEYQEKKTAYEGRQAQKSQN
jgi:hypothetical protein